MSYTPYGGQYGGSTPNFDPDAYQPQHAPAQPQGQPVPHQAHNLYQPQNGFGGLGSNQFKFPPVQDESFPVFQTGYQPQHQHHQPQPQHPHTHIGGHGLPYQPTPPPQPNFYAPQSVYNNQQPSFPHAGSSYHPSLPPPIHQAQAPLQHPHPQQHNPTSLTHSSVPLAPAPTQQPTPVEPVPPISKPIKLRIPAMPTTRRQEAQSAQPLKRNVSDDTSAAKASGSEYGDSDAQHDASMEMEPAPEPEETPEPVRYKQTRGGRRVQQKSYIESSGLSDEFDEDADDVLPSASRSTRRSTRTPASANGSRNDKSRNSQSQNGGSRRSTRSKNLEEFVTTDEDAEKADDDEAPWGRRLRTRSTRKIIDEDDKPAPPPKQRAPPPYRGSGRYATRGRPSQHDQDGDDGSHTANDDAHADGDADADQDKDAEGSIDVEIVQSPPRRLTRGSRKGGRRQSLKKRSAADEHDQDGYVEDDKASVSSAGSPLPDDAYEEEEEEEPRGYGLRKRARVNYAIPPPLEDMPAPPAKKPKRPPPKPSRGLGWSATGAQLSRWMGEDSDSDRDVASQGVGLAGAGGAVLAGGGFGGLPAVGDVTIAGGPSNMGKIGDAALADADPLGVNPNITFDEVGGLDEHISSLKEMTLLPLLYPEVFQRFSLTPPRGVLFHGPPGTGKTLLARALAASCRSEGRSVSFFMRKGADCLSKWVGEAERQLRLLFDEAKACQPSIIFFDEIDGLAPVRSSKQDQVHASIVSTLLALMDGMDGRGQVVVIGATNRPDAIDPALRRPGRFDREFYFPLPDRKAREKIVKIMTKKWDGWDGEKGEKDAAQLAEMTKGYGGADLRALCTEAALNAVQRRYPQIYQSTERLLLKPETIGVELRDFMLAVKKLVPSSARSTSASAAPLPGQLVPLLEGSLENVKSAIDRVMPVGKKRSALEEAQYEEEEEGGALQRELMLQAMEKLRVYRPRIALHGPEGAGQNYVAAAALHHLEGYHVQSLELGNLLSDSTRTLDAAIVQLFMEAKRNQPSVVYLPSLNSWCAAVAEGSRATVRAMLDSLAPTDPVLLLAVIDGAFSALPRDVKAWFGPSRENRVLLPSPTEVTREAFFGPVLDDVQRPPNQFPDGVKRRKRVLEVLPLAPPLEPRQPSAAELAAQDDADQRTIALLKFRLGPILTELKRKFKRFTKAAREEYDFEEEEEEVQVVPAVVAVAVEIPMDVTAEVVAVDLNPDQVIAEDVNGIASGSAQMQAQLAPPPPVVVPATSRGPKLHDMDLEKVHTELYRNKYLTPKDFLDDIGLIAANADMRRYEDADRAHKALALYNAAEVSIIDIEPALKGECDRMAIRERKRRAQRKEERRKAKEEAAAASGAGSRNSGTPVDGVRRSTRNNGQLLNVDVNGDPTALERKLKRARSSGNSPRTPLSVADEVMGNASGDGRSAKRSRMSIEADDTDPMSLGYEAPSELPSLPNPSTLNGLSDADTLVPSAEAAVPVVSPRPQRTANLMNLLNPTPESTRPDSVNASPAPPLEKTDVHLVPAASDLDASMPAPMISIVSPGAMQVDEQAPRTPSPRPDFVCPQTGLEALKEALVRDTAPLSVEELEQLRASCVGAVWRHRANWDRSALLEEMREMVVTFIQECQYDED